MQTVPERLAKYVRLNRMRRSAEPVSPPFLILFINSICNMKCEHCFYWQQLNQRDDLTFEEIVSLSRELGPIQNLNLSGGEPFIRKEFGAICREFIRNNQVKEIYCPTNGYFTERTIKALREVLQEPGLEMFGVEISLDGMPAFHDEFRKSPNSFRKAMETYDALVALQREDPRVQIHAISTATAENMDEIRMLTTFLFDRCQQMSHHNLAIIRGDRKNPSLQGPTLQAYNDLYAYIRRLWAPREEGRYGAAVEPMLQYAKVRVAESGEQFAPCLAGLLTGVVYANGDVGICEQRAPIGNLRQSSFMDIWRSHHAKEVRKSIACKECACTNEIYMWSSIAYQPASLMRAAVGAQVWRRARPLAAAERADYSAAAAPLSQPARWPKVEEVAAQEEAGHSA